ncbi:hypothetical protein VB005_07675 [Metarhizium brunneum]
MLVKSLLKAKLDFMLPTSTRVNTSAAPARARTMALERISRPVALAASRRLPLAARPRGRWYATAKEPGPTSQFYKTFTRPIAKVLVVAVFSYQLIYWGWVKLEADEHRQKTDAEIADLEAKVGTLDKALKDDAEAKEAETPKKKGGWW